MSTTVLLSLEKTIVWIKLQISKMVIDNLTIKIGNGWKQELNRFVTIISREFSKYGVILIVDEKRTSIKDRGNKTIHEYAAILIARRDGFMYHTPQRSLTHESE